MRSLDESTGPSPRRPLRGDQAGRSPPLAVWERGPALLGLPLRRGRIPRGQSQRRPALPGTPSGGLLPRRCGAEGGGGVWEGGRGGGAAGGGRREGDLQRQRLAGRLPQGCQRLRPARSAPRVQKTHAERVQASSRARTLPPPGGECRGQ